MSFVADFNKPLDKELASFNEFEEFSILEYKNNAVDDEEHLTGEISSVFTELDGCRITLVCTITPKENPNEFFRVAFKYTQKPHQDNQFFLPSKINCSHGNINIIGNINELKQLSKEDILKMVRYYYLSEYPDEMVSIVEKLMNKICEDYDFILSLFMSSYAKYAKECYLTYENDKVIQHYNKTQDYFGSSIYGYLKIKKEISIVETVNKNYLNDWC